MSGGESESETNSSSRCNNTGRHSGGGGGEGGLSLERGERGALKKGPWTSAEDSILVDYVKKHGEGNWNAVQKHSGLFRCGKSCRLRWANHLRPNLKKGAFTAEEESIIIELHAKLGNKWARMAAQLPGRTDNEIKNYWNTRIKRRQRQGLPLYPPDLHLQGDNQQNQQPNLSSGNAIGLATNNHDFLTKLDIPNVTFDNYKPGGQHPLAFSSVPALSEVSMNSFLNQALGYSPPGYRILNPIQRMKRTREMDPVLPYGGGTTTGTAIPSFAQFLNERSGEPCNKSARISAPFDHQSGRLDAYANNTNSRLDVLGFGFDQAAKSSISFQNPSSFIGGVGSHALLNNGTFSNSMPLPGVKLELPSSQVAESVLTSTGTPLEAMCGGGTSVTSASSPYTLPSAAPPMDCFSPHNSGLLEALLQESQALGGGRKKQQSSSLDTGNHFSADLSPDSKVSDCVLPSQSENGCGEYNDPITPLGGPAASIFSENTPPLSSGPWEESSSTLSATGVNPKSEEPNELISSANCGDEELSNILNLARLDVPPVSDWYDSSNTDAEKEPSAAVSDALATLFNDDFGADMQQLTSGTCSSSQASWGLGSCHWNNMPGATQIADLP